MLSKFSDVTAGKWKIILAHYGLTPRQLSGKNCPCPMCGGKDRFRFWDRAKNGKFSGMWICNQCTPSGGDGAHLVMAITGKPFREICDDIKSIAGVSKKIIERPVDNRPRLKAFGKDLVRVTPGDGVSKYLQARKLRVPPNVYMHPGYRASDGGLYQCMVGEIRSSAGRLESYHLTYIDGGRKARLDVTKRILPPVSTITGCAIYLDPLSTECVVAEGIETALAASALFGGSAVAAMSAAGMRNWVCPEKTTHIIIAGDHDKSYAGQASAYALAEKMIRIGKSVDVKIPGSPGDWADK